MLRIRMIAMWACTLGPLTAHAAEPVPKPLRHIFVGSFLQPGAPRQAKALGVVQDADFDNMIIQPGEHVRVTCVAPCAAKVGDKLFTFAASSPIQHPITRKLIGHLTDATGLLTVTRLEPDALWAQVNASVLEIERGQQVAALSDVLYRDVLPKRPKVTASGHVVAIGSNLLLGREERLLYVDVGTHEGLEMGDVITVMGRRDTVRPPLPANTHTEAVAQIVLVNVGDTFSTAVVSEGLWEVALGDTLIAAP